MKTKNKNLVLRIVSALILLPATLFLIALGGAYSAGLMALAAAACVGEYYWMTQKRLGGAAWVGVALASLLPLYPLLFPRDFAEASFWTTTAFFFFSWTYHLIAGPLADAPSRSANLVSGFLYGSLGLMALSALRLRPNGVEWVVCALSVTWLNDTSAYFVGRLLGRRKLYAAVSPNKTWEGFLGGLAGSIAALWIVAPTLFPALTAVDCWVLGVLGGILGPIGDLCESMLKRAYGVKDSGSLIPGHGGLLDRIDALLFNAPLVFFYAQFAHGKGVL